MSSFELVQCQTSDNLIHQGLYAGSPSAKRGLVWIHGLTSSFYANTALINSLAECAVQSGFSFVSFNTRGHDCISGIRKSDPNKPKGYSHVMGGAGYEVFSECVYDIQGAIGFLQKKGVEEVFLIGHSTGANKACYYQAEKDDPRVAGLVLLSPLSDRYGHANQELLRSDIQTMTELVKKGKGDTLVLDTLYFPLTPKRFISLMTPGLEDQFGYGENPPQMPLFSKIQQPLLVLFGEKDEYADRPTSEILRVFNAVHSSYQYTGELVSEAFHNFFNKEEYVSTRIIQWITSV